jgi:membrane protease YdiL (CAAX protease family)
MTTNNLIKRIITYLILVFVISAIFDYLIFRGGGLEGDAQILALPLMWSPAVAALITTSIFQRNLRGLGLGLAKPRYFLIGYLLPIVYAGIAYSVVWLSGLGGVDPTILGANPWMGLLNKLTLGVLQAALLALGEEIGWRGFLVPHLAKLNSFTRTALISGIIWGVWHIPLIIGGGYSSGAPTWYAILCFTFDIVGMAFAFAWLRLSSGSIWPAVLMHGVHNLFIQGVLDAITVNNGNTRFFTTEFGLGLAIMGLVVGLVFARLGKKLDDPSRKAVGA